MAKQEIEVDVAVIGAGSAGMVAHRQALAHGARRVVLIEGGVFGTTCARVGCMPSKLLIAAAEAAAHAREAEAFGVHADALRIDGAEVMARVRRERDRFVQFVVDSVERIDQIEAHVDPQFDPRTQDVGSARIRGWARFIAPQRLLVEREDAPPLELAARTIVIATGSKPTIPAPLRGLGPRVLTSDDIFDLPTLPRSLAVVGTGVIGLELGSAMTRLGVATQIFDISERMPLLRSKTMQAEARKLFAARLDLHLGIRDMQAQAHDDGLALRWTSADGQSCSRRYEYVLVATGRRPQLERLTLEHAGIELDERGAPRSWDRRTTQIADAPVFMAGDVDGHLPLLHEATSDGRIAGTNAARWPDVRAHVRQTPLAIMFTAPNLAVVGEVPDAEGEGSEWECGEVDFGRQGRARVINQNHGRARIYAQRKCGTLIGAELIGPQAEHLAHLLAWAIQQGLSAQKALEMPYYHPVLEEGLRTAISALARRLQHVGEAGALDCGPGA